MSYEELSKSVKLSEGFRNKIYQDTEGFDTIGWGHKVVPADNFLHRFGVCLFHLESSIS